MSLIQVTTSFVANTRARAAEVNQNFTDLVNILKGDHHNPGAYSNGTPITVSGLAPGIILVQSGMVSNQALQQINTPGLITPNALQGVVLYKFGGNGSDLSLSITSGTTNIDVSAARTYVKNYTSLSITGTGALTFSNPHANGTVVLIKSIGNVTLTSSAAPMLSCASMGAAGGVSVTSFSGNGVGGQSGTDGDVSIIKTNKGTEGGSQNTVGVGGAVGVLAISQRQIETQLVYKYLNIFVGAGGSSGTTYNNSGSGTGGSGAGGRGGGCLIIECAGSWNFTTTNGISVAGENGGNATLTAGSARGAGGGGGGGGGFFLAFYQTLVANSGTVNVAAGTGGNCAINAVGNGYGGGGGGSGFNAGSNGTVSGVNGTKTGGDGGAGASLITANTELA